MSTLIQLKSKRGFIKGALTRFETFLRRHQTSDEIDLTQLQSRLDTVLPLLLEFNNVQDSIEISDQVNLETELLERETFEDSYFSLTCKAKDIITKHTFVPNSAPKAEQINNLVLPNVRLPTLDLPKFSGNYDEWVKFEDTFISLVHTNSSLSDIQKFYYLNSCLSGEASNVIHSLEVTNSNYSIAWNLLRERFDNKRLIIRNHVKGIFSLGNISKETYQNLRNLVDSFNRHLRCLTNLGEPTEHWDTLLIYQLASKLDFVTHRDWEKFSLKQDKLKIDDLLNFINEKCTILETLHGNVNNNISNKFGKLKLADSKQTRSFLAKDNTRKYEILCTYCKRQHLIYNCPDFLKLNAKARYSKAKQLEVCLNCLRKNHTTMTCNSSCCKICSKKHNTLLHFNSNSESQDRSNISHTPSSPSSSQLTSLASSNQSLSSNVLLSTALIQISDNRGNMVNCRALLDNGSQSNFITEALYKRLRLPCKHISMEISGLGSSSLNLSKLTSLMIQSQSNKYSKYIDCLVIPRIANAIPSVSFSANMLNIPPKIVLADPAYYKSGEIDMLLGAGVFWELLCIGQISLGKDKPILQKTQLGWVVSGNVAQISPRNSHCHVSQNLETQISKFWEIEEIIPDRKVLSPYEKYCETLFSTTTTRTSEGRFIVKLPFKSNVSNLGESKHNALKRFYSLERKLGKNQVLKQHYNDFMNEYESLGHMSKINIFTNDQPEFYLPHHAVLKESSLTTKVRVVFDGSACTSNEQSLNDCQMVGPVLQDDLFSILLRFRRHPIVLAADISKMYRQILVSQDDRKYQKILWRYTPDETLQTYTLNTVTYGTAAASFLAIRSLQQVAHDHSAVMPEASSIILSDFYVDDLLTGTDSIENAILLQREITSILQTGCFELRKWVSNNTHVLDSIPNNSEQFVLSFSESKEFKTLGLQWNTSSDQLQYSVMSGDNKVSTTKRTIISTIAQIFDPLGLLGPYIITAKIIIQKLWQLKLDWDESIPTSIYNSWLQFQNSLPILNHLKINRFAFIANATHVEIHGFCDASESAYGACIYIRSIDSRRQVSSNLLCAKSRIAPIKNITLPRLELCGALLLAKLVKKTTTALKFKFDNIYYWCDSTVVLCWLTAPSNQWKTFVANRVAEILELSDSKSWNYVNTNYNPSDLLTRGITISSLLDCSLWWHGPSWLLDSSLNITSFKNNSFDDIPELRQNIMCNIVVNTCDIFDKFSQFQKLQRVTAYCQRFIHNCKKLKHLRLFGELNVTELKNSTNMLIKIAQIQCFSKELQNLKNYQPVNHSSNITSLNPFIDSDGILRVGGRIQNSNFNYNKCHPIILPHKHKLTNLIVKYYHNKLLHAGTQLILANIRETYWPIRAKNIIKQTIHECVRCFRTKAHKYVSPMMGNLPKERLTPARPFLNSGVDFAGPILLKDKKSRGFKLIKSYICIFMCFSTKAIHIELVSDLSTDSFIAALRRFTARRGICMNIYSDNGSNFVGASTELKELYTFLRESSNSIQTHLANENINWHFIPPRSPHFGGLWEAGVKSMKHHLKRVVGAAHLTFEELYTILTQIEACLNSRPLIPLSNDPNDLNALTPAHFLIGESLKGIPDPNLLHLCDNRLSTFQRCQKLTQHFWQRWSKEYVSTLQGRSKWKQSQNSSLIVPGALVLVRDEILPPLRWKLGRILETHPGSDKIVRVVTIQTAQGTIKRAVHKTVPLPIDDNLRPVQQT